MSSKEEFICYHCSRKVEYSLMPIQCDLCYNWFHGKCEKLKRSDWLLLGKSQINWYCKNCKTDIFPFNKLDNDELIDFLSGMSRELHELHK